MMLKFVLCFLMFVCNSTTPAESSVNLGDLAKLFEGMAKNGFRFFKSLNKVVPEIPCPESVDFTSGFIQEVPAFMTVLINGSKCHNRDDFETQEVFVVRLFPELTYESKLLDVQSMDMTSDVQSAESSDEEPKPWSENYDVTRRVE